MTAPGVSAVLAYADRVEVNRSYRAAGFLLGLHDYTGRYSRDLLFHTARALNGAGVDEVLIVTPHTDLGSFFPIPIRVRFLFTPEDRPFSEWDSKLLGIQQARHDHVITTNADILVSRELVNWFRTEAAARPTVLFHGTKAWLNEDQTAEYLRTGTVNGCRHEVVVAVVDETEVFVDGLEPRRWCARRLSAAHYLREYGIDLWKHGGDFQAFHRSLLERVEYPVGSVGWGWGDSEFRLRVRLAGLSEVWNRASPVWHMFHPVRPWPSRRGECEDNMRRWNRHVDLSIAGDGWAGPPSEATEMSRRRAAPYCACYLTEITR